MPRTLDVASATVSLADGESLSDVNADGYLDVDTRGAEDVHIHIDDGSRGEPATYTLDVEAYKYRFDDWMYDDEQTGQTARTHYYEAKNNRMRFDVTNTSGTTGDATFRVNVEAVVTE